MRRIRAQKAHRGHNRPHRATEGHSEAQKAHRGHRMARGDDQRSAAGAEGGRAGYIEP